MIDILREEKKQNHVKCSVKTGEGKKKKKEGNTKEKQTETSNKFSNKLMCDKVTIWQL